MQLNLRILTILLTTQQNTLLQICFNISHGNSALQLSLYWDGNLSYFMNKRKEFEFYKLNPVDLQYLAILVRGKVPKTVELQGNSHS